MSTPMLPPLRQLSMDKLTSTLDGVAFSEDDDAVDAADVWMSLQRVYNWCWRSNNPDKHSPELPHEVEWGVGLLSSVYRYSEKTGTPLKDCIFVTERGEAHAWEVVAKYIVDYFLEEDEVKSSYPKVIVDQMLDAKEFQAMSNDDVRALHEWILELQRACIKAKTNSTLRSRNSHYERS